MPSEWLLRLRALRQGSDFLETCANRANRASSPTNERAIATQSTNAAAFGTFGTFGTVGTQHLKRPSVGGEANAQVEWRELFEKRAAARERLNHYTRVAAERRAWGEIENRWHLQHGDRIPRDLCAGCRKPIGNAEALDMIDGNRVHLKPDPNGTSIS
jgi:hypothetical protein